MLQLPSAHRSSELMAHAACPTWMCMPISLAPGMTSLPKSFACSSLPEHEHRPLREQTLPSCHSPNAGNYFHINTCCSAAHKRAEVRCESGPAQHLCVRNSFCSPHHGVCQRKASLQGRRYLREVLNEQVSDCRRLCYVNAHAGNVGLLLCPAQQPLLSGKHILLPRCIPGTYHASLEGSSLHYHSRMTRSQKARDDLGYTCSSRAWRELLHHHQDYTISPG